MDKIKWIVFSVIVAGFLGVLVIFGGDKNSIDSSKINPDKIQVASESNGNIGDHVYGNTESKVILVNYGDYQCPGCAGAHPLIKKIVEEYKDKIQFTFRNFPLSGHTNALAASSAVEAAGLQGKYWEMHNKMYESQSDWTELDVTERTEYFKELATSLDLDIDKLIEDMASTEVRQKINYDKAVANQVNLTETPTFYLNGEKIDSEIWGDEDSFKKLLDETIKENN